MNKALFVYGTLAPGQPNEHLLSDVEGSWQPARVRGRLTHLGWGAGMCYPGLNSNHKCKLHCSIDFA